MSLEEDVSDKESSVLASPILQAQSASLYLTLNGDDLFKQQSRQWSSDIIVNLRRAPASAPQDALRGGANEWRAEKGKK